MTNKNNTSGNKVTDWRHDVLIDYRAINGLITDDDGMHKLTVDEFAAQLGVTRKTLYEWQKQIPSFWTLVADRRKEINPQAKLSKMHEVWYLSALRPGNEGYKDRMLWLANFDPNFKMPTEKHQMDVSDNLADVMNLARERRLQAENVIDGETVDNATNDA